MTGKVYRDKRQYLLGRDPELRALRVRMLECGWSRHDLAARAGVSAQSISNLLTGNPPRWSLRQRINRIVAEEAPEGFRTPIFTIPHEFQ